MFRLVQSGSNSFPCGFFYKLSINPTRWLTLELKILSSSKFFQQKLKRLISRPGNLNSRFWILEGAIQNLYLQL
ncbi:hypothetical protein DHB64_13670 [Antarcticibacterium sp. W02-3]|nr:hypothetical protein [Antarcticibacterium sp. W02-3]